MNKSTKKKLLLPLLLFSLFTIFADIVSAQSEDILLSKTISELESTAVKAYQNGKYQKSISIWSNILKHQKISPSTKAEIYCHIAATYRKIGMTSKAISYWQNAISIYRDSKKSESLRLLTTVLLDKAQGHNALGQIQYSRPLLEEAISIATLETFTELEAVGYQALGNARVIGGNWESAISDYSKSFSTAEKLNDTKLMVVALNNLSNTFDLKYQQLIYQTNFAKESGSIETEKLFQQSSQMAKKAWNNAKKAVNKSESKQTLFAVEAKLHLLKLYQIYSKAGLVENIPSEKYINSTKETLLLLPNSQRKTQALIELAKLQQNDVTTLNLALEIAEKIGHLRTQSLALGHLGSFYEQKQNYHKALELSYQARQVAKQAHATDILYQWDWQVGRILSHLNKDEDAQFAYQHSINSLQLIRNQISATGNSKSQIDFQLKVEPVYRELMKLLLKKNYGDSLKQTLEIKQLLQLSELENFFGEDCIIVRENVLPINSASNNTAIIHTIILNQNTYLILKLPNGKLKKFLLPISSTKIAQLIEQWRYDLENQENERYLQLSQQLYQLLIEIIEPDLATTNTQKLIFVNDGILRNVPMAALHNGKQFLIEKYAISNSLGFDLQFKDSTTSKVNILAFGLASGTSNLPALPHVNQEINKMKTTFNSRIFLNEEFNLKNLRKQTENEKYNVIHIATHGKFSGTAEQTYLQAYQQKINLKEFEQILNQREIDSKIDLLTLTACDTAVGNNRAVLGLAGVAIRANIDNVLGTLWSISDTEIVALISNFYRYWLENDLSKSHALRSAQIDMIENPNFHPAIWSSLILIEK